MCISVVGQLPDLGSHLTESFPLCQSFHVGMFYSKT